MSTVGAALPNLPPLVEGHPACAICGGRSTLFDVVDFNKSCEERNGRFLPLKGIPVYYHRCQSCGFTFADGFGQWTDGDFLTHIYNEEYVSVDPDYVEIRPRNSAQLVTKLFDKQKSSISVLDYGAGEGMLADLLAQNGFRSTAAYDPFGKTTSTRPGGQYDLITCFEVMEHVPDPLQTVADIAGFLEAAGLVVFSTLLQPENFDQIKLKWWYASPRNGHISLFSRAAIEKAWASVGFRTASFNANLHMAFDAVPAFARHLVKV